MCYSCGCGKTNDNMGDERNITDQTIENAAQAAGISKEEAMKNIMKTIGKKMGKDFLKKSA